MQFFGTPQRIAKKRSIGVSPMYPLCALAELSQGSGVNIVYIKLCRGANNAPRLSGVELNCLFISPIKFLFLFVERLPMVLDNSDLSKTETYLTSDEGYILYFANIISCLFTYNTTRRLVRVGR